MFGNRLTLSTIIFCLLLVVKCVTDQETLSNETQVKDNVEERNLKSDSNTGVNVSVKTDDVESKEATEDPVVAKVIRDDEKDNQTQSTLEPEGTAEIKESAKETQDAMPSFDEWKKKMLSEVGIKDVKKQKPPSGGPASVSNGGSTKGSKKSVRNYASYECGAKVVQANPEAQGTSRILNEQLDEYMLNPCTAKIWFIIELCESIQPTSVELANLELFSSLPKDFNIYGSDHYPTRDWTHLGSYTAEDARRLQSFEFSTQTEFRKYLKFEMISSYGSEHYCPLSVVRVYGTSVVEEFDAIERANDERKPVGDEDDELEMGLSEESLGDGESTNNILGSAKEAVFNIMRKAAQALSKSQTTDGMPDESVTGNQTSRIEDSVHYYTLFPLLQPLLSFCEDCHPSYKPPKNSTTFNRDICRYLRALLGKSGYDLLCLELQKDPKLRFKSWVKKPEPTKTKPSVGTEEVKKSTSINPTESQATFAVTAVKNSTSFDNLAMSSTVDFKESTTFSEASPDENSNTKQSNLDQLSDVTSFLNQSLPKDSLDNVELPTPLDKPNVTQVPPLSGSSNGMGIPPLSGSQSKESVFIRMNNKIKALEVNLSLTSQYLEELSQRYRRQMDEMQHTFNKTVMRLNFTSKALEDVSIDKEEKIRQLQARLLEIDEKVQLLVAEKETLHWQFVQVHMVLLITEIVIMISILSLFERRMSARIRELLGNNNFSKRNPVERTQTPRKRLADSIEDRENQLAPKTKRLEGDLLIVEPTIPILIDAPAKKKKRRKKHGVLTTSGSLSNYNLSEATHSTGLHRSNSVSTFHVNTEPSLVTTHLKTVYKSVHQTSNSIASSTASISKPSDSRDSHLNSSNKRSEKFNWKKLIKFDKHK